MIAETSAPDRATAGLEELRRAAQKRLAPEPAPRFSDFRLMGAGSKAKQLMGMIKAHHARARRASMPKCRVFLGVYTPAGKPAVFMSY